MLDPIGVSSLIMLAALVAALYVIRKALSHAHGSTGARAARRRRLLLEVTEVVLAAVFFLVGGAKLVGRRDMILLFQEIGVGQWLRYLTGTIEVMGAALLVAPLLSGAAALSLGAIMIVASLVELFVLHRPPVAALACLTGHTFVAWSRMSHARASQGNKVARVSVLGGEPVAPPILQREPRQ